MLRQLELADDLGAEQADDVARDAEPEAGEDLLGDRGAAEHVALLEDERLQAGPGEVGGADEPVVTAADDDRVVALCHVLLRRAPGRARVARSGISRDLGHRRPPGRSTRYAGWMGPMQSSGSAEPARMRQTRRRAREARAARGDPPHAATGEEPAGPPAAVPTRANGRRSGRGPSAAVRPTRQRTEEPAGLRLRSRIKDGLHTAACSRRDESAPGRAASELSSAGWHVPRTARPEIAGPVRVEFKRTSERRKRLRDGGSGRNLIPRRARAGKNHADRPSQRNTQPLVGTRQVQPGSRRPGRVAHDVVRRQPGVVC